MGVLEEPLCTRMNNVPVLDIFGTGRCLVLPVRGLNDQEKAWMVMRARGGWANAEYYLRPGDGCTWSTLVSINHSCSVYVGAQQDLNEN